MKECRLEIWEPEEYRRKKAFGFLPHLHAYVHDDEVERPGILICPGGGYRFLSANEGRPVALRFYELGYQCFVCTYTVNPLDLEPVGRQALYDLGRAVRLLRSQAEKFHLDPTRLVVMGFSAGAHAAESLAVHCDDIPEENPTLARFSARPTAAVLGYPVATSGRFRHHDSFLALQGVGVSPEEHRYMSLEMQITPHTPPCFVWHTLGDELVPAENSLLLLERLRENQVKASLVLFATGNHGLSTADARWAACRDVDFDVREQTDAVRQAILDGEIPHLADAQREEFLRQTDPDNRRPEVASAGRTPNAEVQVWPDMANTWLREVAFKD